MSPPIATSKRSFEERATDLVAHMTLDEKISQLRNDAPAIPRLGVPAYEWWNEALHGVARAGAATVFPQAIGLAATFDPRLMHEVATAISDEARAEASRVRTPRPARSLPGSDFLVARTSTSSAIRAGAAGRRPMARIPISPRAWAWSSSRQCRATTRATSRSYATAKHFAVHSGPEADRHQFDVHPSERDLYETYLPALPRVGAGGSRVLGDGRVQPRKRRVRFGEPAPVAAGAAKRLGLRGLRRLRLRFDRRHLPASQDRRHGRSRGRTRA